MRKIYFLIVIAVLSFYNNSIYAQGNTCDQATPFCTAVGTPFTFPNTTGASVGQTGPDYGCLLSQPRPSWFYVKSSSAGAMTYSLTQSTTAGGPANLDVDYIAWGPYTAAQFPNACSNLTAAFTDGCSFSASATETMTLNATAAGQFFIVMITNYNGGAGYITFTQTGGPPSDCSITCAGSGGITMDMQTVTNYNLGNTTYAANGSTVTCLDNYVMFPDVPPGGDIVAPCINVEFSPYVTSMPSQGNLTVGEGTVTAFQYCPSGCTNGQLTGANASVGNIWGLDLFMLDTTQTHSFVFCGTPGTASTTTVTLRNCWDNSVIYQGPQTWNLNSASCFTLNIPGGTDIGQAYYTIAPASGSVGLYDFYSGFLFINPSLLTAGTTYTITYHFKSTDNCGFKTSNYVFTVPAAPALTAPSSQTVCSGATVAATNFTLTPAAGGSVSWSNNNTSIGVAATGTTNISSYTAPVVATSQVGSFTVAPVKSGCVGTSQTFSITVNPNPTAGASSTQTITCSANTATLAGTGGGTYNWSGPGITGGGATATPTVNLGGTYIVTVTVAGCTSTAAVTVPQNTTAPSPTASNSATLTCATNTVALSGGPAAGVTYNWSGPGFSGGITGQNAIATAAGTYTLKVTSSVNGCTNTAVTSVAQNTTTPSPTVSNSATLTCITNTVTLSGGPAAGVTYNWSGPGFSGGTTGQNAIGTAAGTYTLKVTSSVNGCTNTAVTTVAQNTTTPSPTASNSTTLTCTTNTVTLSGGPAAGVTYNWSGPGFSGGTAGQNAIGTAPGTYTLKVTDAVNGCTNTAVTTVAQNITPPSPTASNSATLTCTTNTVTLSGGPAAGVTYNWSGPGFSGGTTGQNAIATAAGTYTLKVTSSVNGCTNTAVTTVAQNITPPSPTASNSATLTCTTNTVTLSGGPAAGVTYNWSGPGFSGGTTGQNAIGTAPGTYTLKVTDAVNGCTNTAVTTVAQNTTAPFPTASNSTTLTCTTNTVTLSGGPAAGVTYNWSGPGFSGGTTGQNAIGTAAGTYTLKVTSSVNGCTNTAVTSVAQNTTAPVPSITAPSTLTCASPTITLSGSPSSGVTYTWTGSGIVSGANTSGPSINQPGTYSLTVTNSVNGCTATSITSVSQNTATPGITMPATETITCASPTVSLVGSANPSTCTPVWTGGVCAGATSYTASACSPNTYTLTVTDPTNGCTNTGTVSVVPSVGLPAVTASNSGSITCTTTTAQVVATTTASPVSYSWSGPGAVSGSTTSTGTVSVGGTYQCVVTNTLTGCASTITTNVLVDTSVPSATIVPTSTLTCTTPSLVLNAGPSGSPYSISWTGAGLTGSTVATPTVTQGGNFSVVITNTVNGCAGTATVTVATNTTSPTLTVSPTSYTTSCASPTVQLTATSSDPAVTYTWTSPATGSLNNSGIQNPIASGTGIFTVQVTSTTSGCSSIVSSASTATIVPDAAIPTVSLSANTVSLTCASSTVGVIATSTNTPISYSWTPAPFSGGATSTPVFNTAGGYTLTITNTSNGCSTFANLAVVTNTTAPVIAISPTQTLTCATPSVIINTTVTPVSGITYTWSGLGITGSNTGSSITANQADTYTVLVTDATNGCTNTATSDVTGNTTSPTATIAAVSSNSVISCLSPTLSLGVSTTPAAGVSYTWMPGGVNTPTINTTSAGIVSVIVLNTASGCTVSTQYTVTGNTTPPSLATGNTSIPCGAGSTTISASSTNSNVTYNWTGPNAGSITSGSNTSTPSITDPGNYSVTVTDPTNGCSTTSVVAVSQTSITAAFTANPNTGTVPLPVNFTNQSAGATGYTWTFGDGNGSSSANPANTYTTSGSFTVMLVATSGPCSDTAYAVIVIQDGLTLEIPNVFTPNGDNTNDVFTIKSTGVKEIVLQIFNRWGEKLYDFSGPKAGWDGSTGEGAKVPDGTYFFFVKATGYDNKTIEKQGTVSLYR